MLFNRISLIALLLIVCFSTIAQKKKKDGYKLGEVTAKDFDLSGSDIVTPDDEAVILYEEGSTHFKGNEKGWFTCVFTCTRKIKLIKRNAFKLATVQVMLYEKRDEKEKISDIRGYTYSLKNGSVNKAALGKSDIFTEDYDQNHTLKKFTLPALEEGSIIEYTYTITSDFLFSIPGWEFQRADYPVLASEYNAVIPGNLAYTTLRQGFTPFAVEKTWVGEEIYTMSTPVDMKTNGRATEDIRVSTGTNEYIWVMKNVKPLKNESYVACRNNYIDKIDFQLNATSDGPDRSSKVKLTWKDYTEYLWNVDDFKQAFSNFTIKANNIKISADKTETARNIYYYTQKNYKCTDATNFFKYEKLSEVDKKKSGSNRAINLILMGMLKNQGIAVSPVVLSTRNNGFLYADNPVLLQLDYMVCKATIDGKTYLLDASVPELAFGDIPSQCYNGYAVVLNENGDVSSLQLSADALSETETASLFLSNNGSNEMNGKYSAKLGKIQSLAVRQEMKNSNPEQYIQSVQKAFLFEATVRNAGIDSLDEPEAPVNIGVDISFKPQDDIIYFNPVPANIAYQENPFKAEQRTLPVELPYKIDKTFILNMQVPSGYKIDELPKPARLLLNNNQGLFEYLISEDKGSIQMRYRVQIGKTNFRPEDYETLRKFFTVVVEKQNAQIVFKKL
ncbi:MAG TPA: DUF3857 domain-containing protein [Parafilimonas sp.]|nr:DUF3857 domain-containing protein [Parafilimonas sp.]